MTQLDYIGLLTTLNTGVLLVVWALLLWRK